MPIFWEVSSTPGAGRSRIFSEFKSLSMDTAASWPCATAQMMFFGPNAESPPKNTFGTLAWKVVLSRTGRPHLSNSMLESFSIQGKAFSWPTATSTSSHSKNWSGSPGFTTPRLPAAGSAALPLPARVVGPLDLLGGHAGELQVLRDEALRHQEIHDRDALVLRVFLLPGARLHLV